MKKTVIAAVMLLALLLLAVSLTSCASDFSAPTAFRLDTDTLTLKWNKVENAFSYEVRISGDDEIKTTKANYYSLEYLEAGEYTVEVRAISLDQEAEPSKWAKYSFTREQESGLKYKLINNRTEYQVVGGGTALGDVVMESVYRGKPVTSIAADAFKNNKKITSLVVGSNVREIGKNAFLKSDIISITLPDSLVKIGEYAFQSCKQLTAISLPAGVTEISPYMFSWCSSMESCKAAGVKTVGEYAFSNCESLKELELADGLKTIGEYAFSDCKLLSAIELGDGIKYVDSYAFFNCHGVETITLADSLEFIGEAAFANCHKVKTLELPTELKVLSTGAFSGCTDLEAVTIGEKVETFGSAVFSGTKLESNASTEPIFYVGGWVVKCNEANITSLTKLKDGTYGIADYAFMGLENLESVSLKGIKYVGNASFASCSKLWDVKFDQELITLGDNAFRICPALKQVTFTDTETNPSRLTTIGSYAFYDCTVLHEANINLPKSITTIGTYSFNNTSSYMSATDIVYVDDWAVGLKPSIYQGMVIKDGTRGIANYCFYNAMVIGSIDMPDTVEYIGRAAFYCVGIMSQVQIELSANTKYIGDYAFYYASLAWFKTNDVCDGITRIPDGVEYIGRSAFYGCEAMVGLEIPGSVKTIGDYAFYGCYNLGESIIPVSADDPETFMVGHVIFGEGIESIGSRAFQNCTGIAQIVIPDSVTYMGRCAFYKCDNIKSVKLGSGLKTVPEYAFYKSLELESVILSDGVETVEKYAFRGCEAMTSLYLSRNITSIGDYAFYGCSKLSSIEIPSKVKSIGSYAFRGCGEATSIVIPNSVETIGKHAFYGANKATVFCEAESIPAYWSERWNSSYRPVVFGCKLSTDKSFVASIKLTDGAYDNLDATNVTFAPSRDGYKLLGWSDKENGAVVYTAENMINAPKDTVLYAVWEAANEPDGQ